MEGSINAGVDNRCIDCVFGNRSRMGVI
jgi:hypothetical protein